MAKSIRGAITRRDFIKTAGAGVLAAGLGPTIFIPRQARAAGKELKILQWAHFVPRYDQEWFDNFAQKWGEANGVEVTVDHINIGQVKARTAAEISARGGHDLIEWFSPPGQYEPSVVDLTDVNQEAEKRFGKQHPLCKRSSYNPNTKKYYGFCHGWVIDPGDYRKSLWEKVGKPQGPETWEDLITYGGEIKEKHGVQLGIGLSQELDSNMAARALLWSFDTGVQDADENVILNNERTIEAVKFMTELYKAAMTPEVFAWAPASNNRALIAGKASYILNSVSAYRSGQKKVPEIANDVFFVPALRGPRGTRWASEHVIYNYFIPTYSRNVDTAKKFMLALVENYDQAMYYSELYNSPAFFDTPVPKGDRGYARVRGAKKLRDLHNAWFDKDPFALPGEATDKLKPLKDAEKWSTAVGHPGPASPAIGEVFDTYVVANMMANAARGMKPETAVEQAETLTKAIFEKWRKKGLVGGKM
ncbi:MAG: extracellular solute-binding protein [Deltaproteobacteria bacterium]|nr:MAG: extracellular solute-binding protein [Deltaproteobacteria bacterium]